MNFSFNLSSSILAEKHLFETDRSSSENLSLRFSTVLFSLCIFLTVVMISFVL